MAASSHGTLASGLAKLVLGEELPFPLKKGVINTKKTQAKAHRELALTDPTGQRLLAEQIETHVKHTHSVTFTNARNKHPRPEQSPKPSRRTRSSARNSREKNEGGGELLDCPDCFFSCSQELRCWHSKKERRTAATTAHMCSTQTARGKQMR